jgi:dienelactone hydrolase
VIIPASVVLGIVVTSVACSAAPAAREAREEKLSLVSKDARLAATLHLPAAAKRLPAIVLVHGSGRLTGDAVARGMKDRLMAMGLAVLAYDKRGVGASTGEYTGIGPSNSGRMFDLLATDALAAVDALADHPAIDRSKIGLLGVSQGGWIAPLAASRSEKAAFVISLSGPAVTVGEEIAYSNLAGADPGSEAGLSESEIERRFAAFSGPHGYDPVPTIRQLKVPSLWIVGERDRSIPVARTIANLERAKRETDRPIEIRTMPGADHGMRRVDTGGGADFWQVIADWLKTRGIR